jgi:hypothetical protein
MRAKTKPDGFKYWSYILVYTDDLLIIDHEPKVAMDYLASRYTLKPGSVRSPIRTLALKSASSTSTAPMTLQSLDGLLCRRRSTLTSRGGCRNGVGKIDQILLTRVTTPVSQGYRPGLDQSRELDAKRGQYYQSLIGVLRWVCELGRIDVLVAVSMLSRYLLGDAYFVLT